MTIRCYRQDPDRCDRATYGIGLMLDKKAELNASTNYRWTQPCACPSTMRLLASLNSIWCVQTCARCWS